MPRRCHAAHSRVWRIYYDMPPLPRRRAARQPDRVRCSVCGAQPHNGWTRARARTVLLCCCARSMARIPWIVVARGRNKRRRAATTRLPLSATWRAPPAREIVTTHTRGVDMTATDARGRACWCERRWMTGCCVAGITVALTAAHASCLTLPAFCRGTLHCYRLPPSLFRAILARRRDTASRLLPPLTATATPRLLFLPLLPMPQTPLQTLLSLRFISPPSRVTNAPHSCAQPATALRLLLPCDVT